VKKTWEKMGKGREDIGLLVVEIKFEFWRVLSGHLRRRGEEND